MNDGWGGGAMVRFVVPDTTEVLVLEIPANQRRVDVFDDGEWKQLDVDEYSEAVLALPGSAIDNGRVYVKVLVNSNGRPPGATSRCVRPRATTMWNRCASSRGRPDERRYEPHGQRRDDRVGDVRPTVAVAGRAVR